MPRLAKSPVPAHLYRHFAIVTIGLTLVLALFTDGENRQAIAQEIESREEQAAFARASAQKFGKPKLLQAPPPSIGSFGEDVAMGAATTPSRSGAIGRLTPSTPPGTAANIAAARSVGYPEQQLATMGQSEREQLVKGLRSAGVLDQEERRRRAAALFTQSAARSGVESASELPPPD